MPQELVPGEMAALALNNEAVSMLNRVTQDLGVLPAEALMWMAAQCGAGWARDDGSDSDTLIARLGISPPSFHFSARRRGQAGCECPLVKHRTARCMPRVRASGAACGCVCPDCGEALIARYPRRSSRVTDFAHAAAQ